MINILPIIREWLEQHNNGDEIRVTQFDVSREELTQWLCRPTLNSQTLTVFEVYRIEDVDLVIDCLISAGIGRDYEQFATVVGGYQRMES